MYCSNCGASLPDGVNVCDKCGTPVIVNNKEVGYMRYPAPEEVSLKNKTTAALLCAFLGGLGVHRFYVGKVGTGILMLLTGGLFLIGVYVDMIRILCGSFKDKNGLPLR